MKHLVRKNQNALSKKKLLVILIIFCAFVAAISFDLVINNREENPDRKTIPWSEAIRLLNNGEVSQVAQYHSLVVMLTLENGTTVQTTEPAIDAIWAELEKCGTPCKNILRITE